MGAVISARSLFLAIFFNIHKIKNDYELFADDVKHYSDSNNNLQQNLWNKDGPDLICPLVPQRQPAALNQRCSSPNRLSDCPYRLFLLLFDPTWFGICPVRFAVDFGPRKKRNKNLCDRFFLFVTHVNSQFLHIFRVYIAVHRVVLLCIAIDF